MNTSFKYLQEMYTDGYYPNFLVDKVKEQILKVVYYLKEGNHSLEEIQHKLDLMTNKINDLQVEFYENDSDIETVARESIAKTIKYILNHFEVNIDCETAIRNRDW